MPSNRSHAFGRSANHPFDICPLGTRNPYTEQYIVLENGDFLYFPRVSKGSSYADAIYRHSETSTSFYKATHQWVGDGWLTKLQDGSTIHFPESYNAKNLAQGAPTEMTDAAGIKIELIRDGKRNLQEVGPQRGLFQVLLRQRGSNCSCRGRSGRLDDLRVQRQGISDRRCAFRRNCALLLL